MRRIGSGRIGSRGMAGRRVGAAAAVVVLQLAAAGCGPPEPAEEAAEAGIGAVVVTQWNAATELFLEYPHPVAGEPTGNWAIHLSSMETFEPIRSGSLEVRFLAGESVEQSLSIGDVARDGIFLMDPVIARPGRYRVELLLESPQARSRHLLPEVEVFPTEPDAPRAELEEEVGGIAFLKEQQWLIPWSVVPADTGSVRTAVSVPGEVTAPDGALVQVGAPVAGIALQEPNRSAPSVGQPVREGQVLAVLAPTAQEGGFARAVATVQRLGREVERAERLFEVGAIPERRFAEARHDLEVARAEAEAMGADPSGDPSRLRLVSPLDGVVATRSFVPGGRVEAGEPLFTIVSPGAGWLRLSVPAGMAASIPEGTPARYRLEGSGELRETGDLVSVGQIMDPGTRTVPVVFEISEPGRRFVYGRLAEADLPVASVESGLVIPTAAIVDDNGTEVAYVQLGGETFERRILALGATDGIRTVVRAGISPGEMVVVEGAYQVRLASMAGSDLAGAHTH